MANKKNPGVEEVQVVKKKPRGGNSPVIGDNGMMLEDGDNNKFTSVSLQLLNLPKIDLHDPEAVQVRLNEYFNLMAEKDMKPTVAGIAMALGTTRQTLWAIKNNQPMGGYGNLPNMPSQTTDLIKKAYLLMENLWESYMLNGKINPVSGIFLGKNNFGYQDKTEYVLTPNTQQDNDYNADDIRSRYLIDSADSGSDSDSDGE